MSQDVGSDTTPSVLLIYLRNKARGYLVIAISAKNASPMIERALRIFFHSYSCGNIRGRNDRSEVQRRLHWCMLVAPSDHGGNGRRRSRYPENDPYDPGYSIVIISDLIKYIEQI